MKKITFSQITSDELHGQSLELVSDPGELRNAADCLTLTITLTLEFPKQAMKAAAYTYMSSIFSKSSQTALLIRTLEKLSRSFEKLIIGALGGDTELYKELRSATVLRTHLQGLDGDGPLWRLKTDAGSPMKQKDPKQ